jgi:hypothetical protein
MRDKLIGLSLGMFPGLLALGILLLGEASEKPEPPAFVDVGIVQAPVWPSGRGDKPEPPAVVHLVSGCLTYTARTPKIESVGARPSAQKAGEGETYTLTLETTHQTQDGESGAINAVSQFYHFCYKTQEVRDAALQEVQRAIQATKAGALPADEASW